jgi:hypothetical protein
MLRGRREVVHCKDDFFFQQICDEVESTYKDKTVQWSFGKTIFIEGYL